MKKTHDILDISIVALIGTIIGLFIGGALGTHKYEPRIAALQVMLIEQQDACPESMKCYKPYGTGVEPEYILQGSVVKVDFVTEEELIELAGNETTDGWAEYMVPENGKVSLCRITTTMPERVLGDAAMDTLGHELLHCLTGSFHE